MERGFFEQEPNIEVAAELGELRAGFGSIVKNGTKSELADLISHFPQRSRRGKLIWLLTSGLAVELTTGYKRHHHDLDIVVMDPNNLWRWEFLGTDNVTPGQYWADMKFDPKILALTALTIPFQESGRAYKVEAVHPTIIMTQKLSNAFGRKPRDKDILDAISIAKWWEGPQKGKATWINIVNHSLLALPAEQTKTTETRITQVAEEFPAKL